MKSSRSVGTVLAVIVILSVLLAACTAAGCASADGGPGATDHAPAQPTQAPAPESRPRRPSRQPRPRHPKRRARPRPQSRPQAPAAAGGGKYGGILKHAYFAPTNLDPAFLSSVSDDEIGRQWGDFLVYTGRGERARRQAAAWPRSGRRARTA